MRNLGLAIALVIAAPAIACSNARDVPPQSEPTHSLGGGGFTPSSRTQINGTLIRVGDGGRIGVIDVQASKPEPDKVFAETILLQRQTSVSPWDATSQVVEIDCVSQSHRIIANLHYKRDGTLLSVMPVETSFTESAAYRDAYSHICDGSYTNEPIATFTSISGFLDLFGPAETSANPQVVVRVQ